MNINIKLRYFIIPLLLIFLFECFQGVDIKPFDGKNISDIENDNDLIKNPTEVTTQVSIIGFFNDKKDSGDKDYYNVFFSTKNTSYEILLTAVPGIDTKVTFYTTSRKMLFNIDRGGKGEPEKLWEYYPIGENIIICVESKTGYNEKVPYVLNFTQKVDNDINEVEPNDTEQNPDSIKLGEEKKGYISPANDTDFYKIVFDDDSFYDYSIKIESQSNLDVNFTLFNIENNKSKFINDYSWGNQEYFPFLSNKKGNYLIKIKGNIKSGSFQNPIYKLIIEDRSGEKIENEEVNYEREFNDTQDDATGIIDGYSVVGVFYPDNDDDWFQFDIIRKAISLNISISRIKGINPKIELYDKDLNLIKVSDNNGIDEGEETLINDINKGNYYIKVSSNNKSLLIYRLFLNVRY